MAQAELRDALKDWPAEELDTYLTRHYPAYWLKVDLPHQIEHAQFVRRAQQEDKRLATSFSFDPEHGVTELTVLRARPSVAAFGHRRCLRRGRRQHRRRADLHHDGWAGARHHLDLA